MVEETKQHAIWATTIMVIVVAVIFMMTGCISNSEIRETQVKRDCIAARGSYGPVPGSTATYACTVR